MRDGTLYCEKCGEDIHIVPDFEPEIEASLNQTLRKIVKDIHGEESVDYSLAYAEEFAEGENETDQLQDWDLTDRGSSGKIKRYLWIIFLCILFAGGIVGSAIGIGRYRYLSSEYQIERAKYYASIEEFDKAVEHYERALVLEPDKLELKFALAEIYFLKNNKMEYEYILRDIVNEKNATVEQLESAYGKLIAIYSARGDYKTINDLLLSTSNESIKSIYRSYIAVEPEFSIKEGYYNSIQPLKLTTIGAGKIYYTLDGSQPDEGSLLYSAPILLEHGDYCVKAVYVNEMGIPSNIVTQNYHVEIEVLPAPDISVVSGEYQFPIRIEVLDETENIYYTTDGSVPTENSAIYSGPIPMPLGGSVFKFIKIEEGKSSEVVERTYTLKLNTDFTPQQAVENVIAHNITEGKIYNHDGNFNETAATYLYEFLYVTNVNEENDFYVIGEVYKDEEGNMTRTGNLFAVNIYSQTVYKLLIENGKYTLVDIEFK